VSPRLVILLAAPVVAASTAWAQNLREGPLGARSAAMGQAAVAAVPDDGSGLVNPAAFAALVEGRLSLSTTAFSYSRLPTDSGITIPSGATVRHDDSSSGGSSFVPASMSWGAATNGPGGRWAAAFSVLVTRYDTSVITQTSDFSASSGYTLFSDRHERTFKRLYAGPSLAWGSGPLRVGLSAVVVATEVREVYYMGSVNGDATGAASYVANIENLWQALGLSAVAGAQVDVIPGALTLGLSARTGLAPLAGRGSFTASLRDVRGGDQKAEQSLTGLQVPDPLELRAGLAAHLGSVELRADALYTRVLGRANVGHGDSGIVAFNGVDPPRIQGFAIDYRLTTEPVVNFSLGANVPLGSTVSVSAGFLTDRSSSGPDKGLVHEDGKTVSYFRLPKIDYWWGTAGVSLELGLVRLDLGGAAGIATYDGKDLAVRDDQRRRGFVGRVFFSGGVSPEKLLGLL